MEFIKKEEKIIFLNLFDSPQHQLGFVWQTEANLKKKNKNLFHHFLGFGTWHLCGQVNKGKIFNSYCPKK